MVDMVRYSPAAWQRLGQAVRRRRVSLGLTQQQLADKAELGVNTITNIENGNRARELNLGRINRALGWVEGSWQIVLDGGDPVVEEPTEAPEDTALYIEKPPHLSAEEWEDLKSSFMEQLTIWLRHRR